STDSRIKTCCGWRCGEPRRCYRLRVKQTQCHQELVCERVTTREIHSMGVFRASSNRCHTPLNKSETLGIFRERRIRITALIRKLALGIVRHLPRNAPRQVQSNSYPAAARIFSYTHSGRPKLTLVLRIARALGA